MCHPPGDGKLAVCSSNFTGDHRGPVGMLLIGSWLFTLAGLISYKAPFGLPLVAANPGGIPAFSLGGNPARLFSTDHNTRLFGIPPPGSLGPTRVGFSHGILPGLQTRGVILVRFPRLNYPPSPPLRLASTLLHLRPHLDFSSVAAIVRHQHHRLPTPQVSSLPLYRI